MVNPAVGISAALSLLFDTTFWLAHYIKTLVGRSFGTASAARSLLPRKHPVLTSIFDTVAALAWVKKDVERAFASVNVTATSAPFGDDQTAHATVIDKPVTIVATRITSIDAQSIPIPYLNYSAALAHYVSVRRTPDTVISVEVEFAPVGDASSEPAPTVLESVVRTLIVAQGALGFAVDGRAVSVASPDLIAVSSPALATSVEISAALVR